MHLSFLNEQTIAEPHLPCKVEISNEGCMTYLYIMRNKRNRIIYNFKEQKLKLKFNRNNEMLFIFGL